ncbi:restriction endonuclease subunit S [Algibacter sp. Ld11]|uniref:restriction endonuclease subunit S n=1 Tax=Algibacter sp. Ld11 TaxID=649150 RepID=UPI003870C13E
MATQNNKGNVITSQPSLRGGTTKQSVSLIPKLRFKEFEGEWEEIKIGEVLKIGSGKDYKHLEEGKIPVYGTGGLMTYVDKYLYEGESVCIGRKGTIDKPVYLNEKFWTVDTLFYTHSFKKSLPKFVFGIFERINWKLYNEASGVPSLSKSTIEKIKVSIPNLPEQQKIANFLTAVDTKLQQLTTKKETLAQYKKGVMQQLFSQQLRFKPDVTNETVIASTQDEAISPIESQFPDWEEKRLGEVCESIKSGKSKSNEGGTYPLYGSTGVIGNCEDYSHDGFFILIARVGANAGTINVVNDKFGVSDNTLVVICNDDADIKFTYFFLDFYNLNRLVFGSGQPLITGGQLKSLKLNLPCFEEQQKIANYLSAIDKKIEAVQTQITQTQAFKKGLLQKMFV